LTRASIHSADLFFPELPELSRLIAGCDNLIRTAQKLNEVELLRQAWRKLWDEGLSAKVTEDPRFRAYRGYVGTRFTPAEIQSVREDFEFAFSMKFDPPEEHVLAWYIAEEQFGEAAHSCLKICDYVQKGRSYSNFVKINFLSRKASFYYNRGKDQRILDVEESKRNLGESIFIHGKVYFSSVQTGDLNVIRYEGYYRNTCLLLFNICSTYGDADGMIDVMIECAKRDRVLLDPFLPALREYFVPCFKAAISIGNAERKRGRLVHLSRLVDKGILWEEEENRSEAVQILGRLSRAG